MKPVRLRPRAREDIEDIWRFVARDSVERADRLVDDLTARFALIAADPEMGAERADLADGLRHFPCGRYIIFYTPEDEGPVVERVLHGARDLPRLFGR